MRPGVIGGVVAVLGLTLAALPTPTAAVGSVPHDPTTKVGLTVSPIAVPPGGTVSLTATTGGAFAGGTVTLQRSSAAGWQTVATSTPGSPAHKTWKVAVGKKLGTASYRVVATASNPSTTATSATKAVKVERHGGGNPRDHAFLFIRHGKPVRWNPCQAIRYKVNVSRAPRQGLADVRETLRRISQPTGFDFKYAGHTHYIPGSKQSQHEPLVIAWAKPKQTSLGLGKGVLGQGGGTYTYGQGEKPHIVTGYAVLDSQAKLTPGFGAGQTEGALLMHELGHAVGLDHAKKPAEIMYPELGPHPVTMYGAGDYRGLTLIGHSRGCP
jgi:hypothetical protein